MSRDNFLRAYNHSLPSKDKFLDKKVIGGERGKGLPEAKFLDFSISELIMLKTLGPSTTLLSLSGWGSCLSCRRMSCCNIKVSLNLFSLGNHHWDLLYGFSPPPIKISSPFLSCDPFLWFLKASDNSSPNDHTDGIYNI